MEVVMSSRFFLIIVSTILFCIGLLASWLTSRRRDTSPWDDPATYCLLVLLLLAPWVVSTQVLLQPSRDELARHLFGKPVAVPSETYRRIAKHRFDSLYQDYTEILRGTTPFRGRDNALELYEEFFHYAHPNGSRFLATSRVDPEKVWSKRLRHVNEAFIRGGGLITRIFVYDSPESRAKALDEGATQTDFGVDARLCDATKLEPSSRLDFIINTSEQLVAHFRIERGDTYEAELISDRNRVTVFRRAFDAALRESTPVRSGK